MARQVTKELAKKIIKKLKGEKDAEEGAHTYFDIRDENGIVIARTSLRHGSNKNAGHDHMPDDLFISPHQAKELARCNMSRDEWLQHLRDTNHA